MSFVKLLVIGILCFTFLGFRFIQFYHSNSFYRAGQYVSLTTTLQSEPTFGGGGQKFTIKTPVGQLISVTAAVSPAYHYGQVLAVTGKLQSLTFPDGSTLLRLVGPHIVLKRQSDNVIAAAANAIRLHTETVYRSALPDIPASLLMGIVFGANEHFPGNFHKDLQTAGVLHVIAASGMNVTFVSAALLYTHGLFLRRRIPLSSAVLELFFMCFWLVFKHQFFGRASWVC